MRNYQMAIADTKANIFILTRSLYGLVKSARQW
jgi:hypothetical protein